MRFREKLDATYNNLGLKGQIICDYYNFKFKTQTKKQMLKVSPLVLMTTFVGISNGAWTTSSDIMPTINGLDYPLSNSGTWDTVVETSLSTNEKNYGAITSLMLCEN